VSKEREMAWVEEKGYGFSKNRRMGCIASICYGTISPHQLVVCVHLYHAENGLVGI